jgi:hypothetical protein
MLPSICPEYYYIDLLFSNHGNLPLKLSTLKFSCGPKITKSELCFLKQICEAFKKQANVKPVLRGHKNKEKLAF